MRERFELASAASALGERNPRRPGGGEMGGVPTDSWEDALPQNAVPHGTNPM